MSFDDEGIQGNHHQYVVDAMTIPRTLAQVGDFGLDIDADPDGEVDNRLGTIVANLPGAAGAIEGGINGSFSRGEAIILADLQTTSLTDSSRVGLTLYLGANPSNQPCAGTDAATCGQHLDGATRFDVALTSPIDGLLEGSLVDGELTAGPGDLAIMFGLFDGLLPIRIDLIGARIEGQVHARGLITGKIAGGITQTQVTTVLLPAIEGVIDGVVARDCAGTAPLCCTIPSAGAALLTVLDVNNDCAVGSSEFDGLVKPLFVLDVDLLDQAGAYDPGKDGRNDALSVGIRFSTVNASFARP